MSIIDEVEAKLKSARRAAVKAKKEWETAAGEASRCRKALDQADARVNEIETALIILRRELKPARVQSGNVAVLRPAT